MLLFSPIAASFMFLPESNMACTSQIGGGWVTVGCLLGRCMPSCIPAGVGA